MRRKYDEAYLIRKHSKSKHEGEIFLVRYNSLHIK